MILAIVQARMASTRLPGKVLKEVLGTPLIGHLLSRLKRSERINKIVVATSTNKEDDPLSAYVKGEGFDVFRGSEKDVLDRYYQAARMYRPKVVVRITADCPLIDYKIVDQVIGKYLENKFDYTSNVLPRTYPDGLDVEAFSFEALEKAHQRATRPADREHVTVFIRESGEFKLGNVVHSQDLSKERWTLDYEEDFWVIRDIFEHFLPQGNYFDMQDILEFQRKSAAVFDVNRKYVG